MSKQLLMTLEAFQANLKKEVFFVKESKKARSRSQKLNDLGSPGNENYEDLLQSSVLDILNDTIPDVIM